MMAPMESTVQMQVVSGLVGRKHILRTPLASGICAHTSIMTGPAGQSQAEQSGYHDNLVTMAIMISVDPNLASIIGPHGRLTSANTTGRDHLECALALIL